MLFFYLQLKAFLTDKADFQKQHEQILIYSLANIYKESVMFQIGTKTTPEIKIYIFTLNKLIA